jgi:predicted esterase
VARNVLEPGTVRWFVFTVLLASCGSSPGEQPRCETCTADAAAVDASVDAAVTAISRCGAPAPSNGPEAPALPSYAGTCPAIAGAPALTELGERDFMVVAPQVIAPNEQLPVVFVWHWLGGSAADAYTRLSLQDAVDLRRFIAVVPEAKGDILFRWPFGINQSDARLAEELQFFDDMLACVGAALPVDKNCVSSMGVSAGALMTAQLAARRSERLSSLVSISGGVGQQARDWSPSTRKIPAFVLWGGPTDMYPETIPLQHFDESSTELEAALAADGHLILECTHNCGHDLPPFDPPAVGGHALDVIWDFLLGHPFWLPAGASIYQEQMPSTTPAWCALGKGAATPRPATLACPE